MPRSPLVPPRPPARLAVAFLAATAVVLPPGAGVAQEVVADTAVSLRMGDPSTDHDDNRRPSNVLGPPDNEVEGVPSLTLGCGGVVVVAFLDNALVDVEGPDLHVFEVGADVEPTTLAISEDGEGWIEVGGIEGGRADVDIAGVAEPGATYSYVRLTDGESDCGSAWPGADLDAVGAIGSGRRIVLEAGVLFDVGEAAVRDEAAETLEELVRRVAGLRPRRVVVEGHTDAVGSAEDNRALSRRRAQSVPSFLAGTDALSGVEFEVRALGETRPVATNETEEGRALNRRVEIVVIPDGGPEGG